MAFLFSSADASDMDDLLRDLPSTARSPTNSDASSSSPSPSSSSSPLSSASCSPPVTHEPFATATPQDWDLLSEMLIDDALVAVASVSGDPIAGFSSSAASSFGSMPPQYTTAKTLGSMPMPMPIPALVPMEMQYNPMTFMDDEAALLMPDLLPKPEPQARPHMQLGSPQTTHLFRADPIPSPPPPSAPKTSLPLTPSPTAGTSGSSTSTSDDDDATLSPEELKRQRRRHQIASSVQRHREKKRHLVASLKSDFVSLTAQLESLRAQRKAQLANNEQLVAWEEAAQTQRRKRKQSEELNQQLKRALFEQSSFLDGMRVFMTNVPVPREMQIDDWLHSYTKLTARDPIARRREYLAVLSDSKMDMARAIVMRETAACAAHLSLSNPFFADIRVVHDASQRSFPEEDVAVKPEPTSHEAPPPDAHGRVSKKYTTMFLFQERDGDHSFEAFVEVALEAAKGVGVFWPSGRYESRAHDAMELEDKSRLMYTHLHGAMPLARDPCHPTAPQHVELDTRVVCRVRRSPNEVVIAWDYVDDDELHPIATSSGATTLRRDACGAIVLRREDGDKTGLVSLRSASIKRFAPVAPVAGDDDSDAEAAAMRRVNLRAVEVERATQHCVEHVYDALSDAFAQSLSLQPSSA
ncbi:hypothetical protein ATCC90586_004739 [Pythium insidiosum]|nr:hypothetical protein ATCC90586_004739 [Pythium insidiosum]